MPRSAVMRGAPRAAGDVVSDTLCIASGVGGGAARRGVGERSAAGRSTARERRLRDGGELRRMHNMRSPTTGKPFDMP